MIAIKEVKYKKLLAICLVALTIFASPATVLAAEAEYQSMQKVEEKQKEIQAILSELNGIAAEEKTFEYLAKDSRELEDEASVLRAQNSTKKQDLEQHLETPGVNTIDPENPSDIAALEEVMLGNNDTSAQSIPDPPNLEAFADAYTVRQYTQNISHNGTSYRYSYIIVEDDKGYNGSPLTHSKSIDIIIGDAKAYETVHSSTGTLAYNYVHSYLDNGYADIDYIGSFSVTAYGGRSVQFTPGFARNPSFLL